MPTKKWREDNASPARPLKVHTRGMAPRVAPPKAWDSGKPPGGKLPPPQKPKQTT